MRPHQSNYELEVEIFTQLSRQMPRRTLAQWFVEVMRKVMTRHHAVEPKRTTAEVKPVQQPE